MALFKQWEILNKCVADSENLENLKTNPKSNTKGLKKSGSKDSAKSSKEKKVSPNKNSGQKVLGDCSNVPRKEPILIQPIYPKMPSPQPLPVLDQTIDESAVVTLSGAQLKCMVKDFANKCVKEEIVRVLQKLNGPVDEDDEEI